MRLGCIKLIAPLFLNHSQQETEMEMIPVIPGRPPVVIIGSCSIFLSIRDTEYIRLNKEFKHRLAASHPDKFPGLKGIYLVNQNFRFREMMKVYKRWKLQQRRIYWDMDHLMPPDWRGQATPPPAIKSPLHRKGYRLIERTEA